MSLDQNGGSVIFPPCCKASCTGVHGYECLERALGDKRRLVHRVVASPTVLQRMEPRWHDMTLIDVHLWLLSAGSRSRCFVALSTSNPIIFLDEASCLSVCWATFVPLCFRCVDLRARTAFVSSKRSALCLRCRASLMRPRGASTAVRHSVICMRWRLPVCPVRARARWTTKQLFSSATYNNLQLPLCYYTNSCSD